MAEVNNSSSNFSVYSSIDWLVSSLQAATGGVSREHLDSLCKRVNAPNGALSSVARPPLLSEGVGSSGAAPVRAFKLLTESVMRAARTVRTGLRPVDVILTASAYRFMAQQAARRLPIGPPPPPPLPTAEELAHQLQEQQDTPLREMGQRFSGAAGAGSAAPRVPTDAESTVITQVISETPPKRSAGKIALFSTLAAGLAAVALHRLRPQIVPEIRTFIARATRRLQLT